MPWKPNFCTPKEIHQELLQIIGSEIWDENRSFVVWILEDTEENPFFPQFHKKTNWLPWHWILLNKATKYEKMTVISEKFRKFHLRWNGSQTITLQALFQLPCTGLRIGWRHKLDLLITLWNSYIVGYFLAMLANNASKESWNTPLSKDYMDRTRYIKTFQSQLKICKEVKKKW